MVDCLRACALCFIVAAAWAAADIGDRAAAVERALTYGALAVAAAGSARLIR